MQLLSVPCKVYGVKWQVLIVTEAKQPTHLFLHLNAEQNPDIKTAINNFNICRSSN